LFLYLIRLLIRGFDSKRGGPGRLPHRLFSFLPQPFFLPLGLRRVFPRDAAVQMLQQVGTRGFELVAYQAEA
ncbi:MAG: hypothetical protein LBI04_05990, partial [Treponema sp.]|nr:hypothetical protein [Treponema sp.]